MFQSMPYKERSLLHVMESLNTNATNNGIPSSIIEDAKMMIKIGLIHYYAKKDGEYDMLLCLADYQVLMLLKDGNSTIYEEISGHSH